MFKSPALNRAVIPRGQNMLERRLTRDVLSTQIFWVGVPYGDRAIGVHYHQPLRPGVNARFIPPGHT
jgi:hypothetical protein